MLQLPKRKKRSFSGIAVVMMGCIPGRFLCGHDSQHLSFIGWDAIILLHECTYLGCTFKSPLLSGIHQPPQHHGYHGNKLVTTRRHSISRNHLIEPPYTIFSVHVCPYNASSRRELLHILVPVIDFPAS